MKKIITLYFSRELLILATLSPPQIIHCNELYIESSALFLGIVPNNVALYLLKLFLLFPVVRISSNISDSVYRYSTSRAITRAIARFNMLKFDITHIYVAWPYFMAHPTHRQCSLYLMSLARAALPPAEGTECRDNYDVPCHLRMIERSARDCSPTCRTRRETWKRPFT